MKPNYQASDHKTLREKFARILVHDLNNPASIIDSALQFIKLEGEDNLSERQRKNLAFAQFAVRDLQRMIANLVDVSKIEEGWADLCKKEISLEKIVQEATNELEDVARLDNKSFAIEKGKDIPLVYADPNLMKRAIMNLIHNSLRYTPLDTVVRIEIRHNKKENSIYLGIQDQGVPIPAKYLDRVFDKYIQAESNKEVKVGRALGLTLCKLVVELHGGRIWAESSSSKGNLIAFWIPISTKKK